MASPIAAITRGATVSPRNARENARVKRGVVFTRSTDAATEVKDRLAIQVAKWTPSATPEATRSARARPGSAGHERAADAAAKGARRVEARKIR
jgi:hypothetical protein